ncbi:hypothetical protein ACOSQ2_017786 [Xanthoceras sorbifolium]
MWRPTTCHNCIGRTLVYKETARMAREDFIPEDEDRTEEEIAKDYLDELINRSLIQVEKRILWRIKTCRVHDLLCDLAIEKAKDLNFLHIYNEINHSNIPSVISSYPRQAIYSMTKRLLWLQKSNPRLRSLFLFSEKGEESVTEGQELATICRTFSSLRVLYIRSPIFEQPRVPEEIRNLIHLKYLGGVTDLDTSLIFNLRRLQTLVLDGNLLVNLSSEIGRLQELKHLIGRFVSGHGSSISNLTKLQTLKYITVHSWVQIKTEKLINLRELRIVTVAMYEEDFYFDSMANLKSLRILDVQFQGNRYSYLSSFQPLSNCRHLTYLRLEGRIVPFPEDIHQILPNLEWLSLKYSDPTSDPMRELEKLPKLAVLSLYFPEVCDVMMCSAKGFPRLEILLILHSGSRILRWQVEEGALPRLRGFTIRPGLSMFTILPKRIRSLPSPDPKEFDF